MQVLTNSTSNDRSLSVAHSPSSFARNIVPVNIFITGMASGDSISVQCLLPDGSDWVAASGDGILTENGMYTFESGSVVLSLLPNNTSGSAVNAWIQPDDEEWRQTVIELNEGLQ